MRPCQAGKHEARFVPGLTGGVVAEGCLLVAGSGSLDAVVAVDLLEAEVEGS